MSKARLVITAVLLEGRSQSQVARDYGVSQSRISRLIARYAREGEAAFEPRSRRPHRSLPHRATPAVVYTSRPKAQPGQCLDTHDRVRTDRVDQAGAVTLRVNGRLHHIGIGRHHYRTRVLILAHDHHITVINAATGHVLRDFTLDPTRDYQPTGAPKGPKTKKSRTQSRSGTIRMSCDITKCPRQDSNLRHRL
ncbi:helix-turn-helix domain-containing protein [Mycobacterium sp. 360MFTsu5.1]|uniref:helix-turn-helix domain-containing protein n=1 Tax=Mycobacterium sp. 360MFTsu5.1 TaxID=1172186 RepID=UPI001E3FEF62|nr:helix-turn-helix domain-containing protein [Mycobacterium sp. 360MFTsu5.1]